MLAVSATDSDRVHGPGPQDDLHASCERVAAASGDAELGRRGFVHREDRPRAGGSQFFQRRAVHQFSVSGQAPTLQNVEERVPVSPGIISAASRVLGNFFRSEYHSLQLRVERRMARSFSLSVVLCAIQESDESAGKHDRADQQHSQSVRPRFAVGAFFPRPPARGRRVVGVESAARFSNAISSALLNGWTVTGFHRIQSGTPLVFTTGVDVAQNGVLNSGGQYPRAGARSDRRRPAAGFFQHR